MDRVACQGPVPPASCPNRASYQVTTSGWSLPMCGTHARPWRRGYPGTFAYGGSSRATVVPLAIAPAWPGPDRRVRHYRLTYADGSRENVAGTTSVLAVAARTRVDRPVEIHDLTESAAWLAQRRGAREAK